MRHAPLAALAVAAAAALLASPSLACAAPRPGPARSGPWSVELVDEGGRALPTFRHQGRTFVLGERGQRYLLRVRNESGARIEVVASVDGRDVIDGRPAAVEKRGYLVDPYGEVTIDGFRLGLDSVAAFRFSSVSRSYAARTGDARDVGVIGVAIFPERERPLVRPYAGEDELAMNEGRRSADRGGAAEAPSAAGPPAASRVPGPGIRSEPRPGLGTEFGEQHASAVREVPFERASPSPAAVLSVRYDDRAGLARLGIDVDGAYARRDDRWLREHAQPFRSSYAQPPPGWER
jgi:hypothetical protein